MSTETKKLDKELHNRLMKLSPEALATVPVWSKSPLSESFSHVLCEYVEASFAAELQRRESKTAEHPPLNSRAWSNAELCGSLTLSSLWMRSCVDGLSEHYLNRLFDTILCEICERLVNDKTQFLPENN